MNMNIFSSTTHGRNTILSIHLENKSICIVFIISYYRSLIVFSLILIYYILKTRTCYHIFSPLYYIFQSNVICCITQFRVELFRTLMGSLIIIVYYAILHIKSIIYFTILILISVIIFSLFE